MMTEEIVSQSVQIAAIIITKNVNIVSKFTTRMSWKMDFVLIAGMMRRLNLHEIIGRCFKTNTKRTFQDH